MHILFLCNEYPPGRGGGIGSFTRTMARGLVRAGCNVTVLGQYRLPAETVEDDQGVTVIRMPAVYTPGVNSFINLARRRQRIHRINTLQSIDLIEGQEIALWGLTKNIPGVKIIRMHGGHHFFSIMLGGKPNQMRALAERASFHNADHLCAVSNFVAETTRDLLNLGSTPIRILPNPVDTRAFCPQADAVESPGEIFFAGTICEKKGIRQLIQELPRIVEAAPEAHLVAAGRDTIDPRTGKSFTAGLIDRMPVDLRERVHFLGQVRHEDLPNHMAHAQVCVYPSHMESQGIVTIEGMAMGKAVVASQTGPGPEIIQPEVNGLLCDPFDPSSIAQAVTRALRDYQLRQRLGAAARKTVEEKYAVDVLLQKNLDFYRDCLEHRA